MLTRRRSSFVLAVIALVAASVTSACAGDPAGPDPRLDFVEQSPGDTLFSSVVANFKFACALTREGRAFCWGANGKWQLGTGLARPSACQPSTAICHFVPSPVPVAGGLRFVSLALESERACGVTPSGKVYCWGGVGSGGGVLPSGVTAVFQSIRAREIRWTGENVLCALATDGIVYCDATTKEGRPNQQPRRVETAPALATLGGGCGLTGAGKLYCWPLPGSRIRVDSVEQDLTGVPVESCLVSTPGTKYSYPCSAAAVPVRTARRFSRLPSHFQACAITAAGEVYCWQQISEDRPWVSGVYDGGQGSTGGGEPLRMAAPGPVKDLLSVQGLACLHLEAGTLSCKGSSWLGGSGNGVRQEVLSTFAPAAAGRAFRSVSSGWEFACGVTATGEAYCWGAGDAGQLGGGAVPSLCWTSEPGLSEPVTNCYADRPTRVASIAGLVSAPLESP